MLRSLIDADAPWTEMAHEIQMIVERRNLSGRSIRLTGHGGVGQRRIVHATRPEFLEAPLYGGCPNLPWSPIASSAAHSQLAGTIASLVFGAIVFLLSTDARARRRHDSAVALLVAGFFAFALDSFIFGVTSGEQLCDRAWTETMAAAGMLAIGALGLFTSLAWLLRIHDARNKTAFRATSLAAYLLAVAGGVQLTQTARDYLHDTVTVPLPAWLEEFVNAYTFVLLALVGVHLVFGRVFRRKSQKMASVAAYASLLYAFSSLILFTIASGFDAEHWKLGTPLRTAEIFTTLALVLPALALVLQLLALPGADTEPEDRAEHATPEGRAESANRVLT